MADNPVLYSFVETIFFTKRLHELASFETLAAIQADLLENPERWPVVRGTHGARKGRVADPLAGQEREFPLPVPVPGALGADLPAVPVREVRTG